LYDVLIIGAGVTGASIARELSRYDLKVCILDKNNDVADATTKANSAIIHAGYDAKPGTLKAKFNALGAPMFDQICKELDVPFKRIGSLVIAFSEEEMKTLESLYEQGIKNGIENIHILDKAKTMELEPNLIDSAQGALHAPDGGIICPFELTVALTENAVENGVDLFLNQQVIDIEKNEKEFKVITQKEKFTAKYVVNCAGVFADTIYHMVTPTDFHITPRKGQYFVLDKEAGNFANTVIFQCPTPQSKGVLVTPTVHGNLLVGPDAEDLNDKTDLDNTRERLNFVRENAKKTSENIPFHLTINIFAGLRAVPDTGDFIIGESEKVKGFINVAGIESPGLSSAPAIGNYVKDLLLDKWEGLKEKENFNPYRRKVVRFNELTPQEITDLVKKNPSYGRIVCRCELVTEGEIIDVIHRKAGATSLDAIKRRVRAGMGRCQGGFCGPRVMEILSRELNMEMHEVVKDSPESKILTGKTKCSEEEH